MLNVRLPAGHSPVLLAYLVGAALLVISGCKTSNARVKLSGGALTVQIGPTKLSPYVALHWTKPGGAPGLGSGVLLKGNQVLTNAHVIESLKERVGTVDLYSGHQSLLLPARVKGFESVIPDLYDASDDPLLSARHDYGLFKFLGEDVLNPAVPIEFAEFAEGGIDIGDLISYIGYGGDEAGAFGNRRIATTKVDALIGDTHLIATGLPAAVAADGKRIKCLNALCTSLDPAAVAEDPVKINGGDSGGAGIDADGRLVAIMALGNGRNLNIAINLLDKEVIAWLAPKLRPYGYVFTSSGYDANDKPRWPFQRRPRDPVPGDKIELHPSGIVFLDSDAQPIDHLEYPNGDVLAAQVADYLVKTHQQKEAPAAAAAAPGDSPDGSDKAPSTSGDGQANSAGSDERGTSRGR